MLLKIVGLVFISLAAFAQDVVPTFENLDPESPINKKMSEPKVYSNESKIVDETVFEEIPSKETFEKQNNSRQPNTSAPAKAEPLQRYIDKELGIVCYYHSHAINCVKNEDKKVIVPVITVPTTDSKEKSAPK